MTQALLLSQRGGGIKAFIPLYTGEANIVLSEDGKSGYMECFTSGTLTWQNDYLPESVDVTCVGGGGGGGNAYNHSSSVYRAGSGGGGGRVITAKNKTVSASTDVFIGAGGSAEGAGGTTMVGALCSAEGGTGSYSDQNKTTAGSGGNAGGLGHVKQNTLEYKDTAGSSNGVSPAASGNTYQTAGTSQNSETKDLFGRRHAGGGSGGIIWYNDAPLPGGESDFDSHSGKDGGSAKYSSSVTLSGGKGGGGAGGGGGGGSITIASGTTNSFVKGVGGAGGDGLAIIAWGDYLAVYAQEVA